MENWLFRTETLVGKDVIECFKRMRVMVCGLGGVGGIAAEALARSGIGHFVLTDCDVFHPTNLNRQIFSTRATIGQPKVAVAKQRIGEINPDAEVIGLEVFVDGEFGRFLEMYPVDFVIDAIDSLNPKVCLIEMLHKRGIAFVSAMGAAARFDASAFRLGRLSDVKGCPLTRKVRQRLRRLGVQIDAVPVVYSTESVNRGQGLGKALHEANYYAQGRTRVPRGSLAVSVMVAGLLCAQSALEWAGLGKKR